MVPETNAHFGWLAVALLLASAMAGCASDTTDDEPETVRIGTLLPLTGSLNIFGPSGQDAIELAVDDLNQLSALSGYTFELESGDTRTNQAETPQEFARLLQAGVVAVIGAYSSGVTNSFLGNAVDNGVLVITPASTAPSLVQRDNQGLFFRVPPSDALQGKVMAKVLDNASITSVSTIFINNDYGQGFNDVMVDEFTTVYGGTVLDEIAIEDKQTNFNSEIAAAAEDDPDAIVFIGYPGEGTPLMRHAHDAGVLDTTPFFFSEGVYDPTFVDGVNTTADGDYILAGLKGTTPEVILTGEGSGDFGARYFQKHGATPRLFAPQAYDAAIAIGLAAIAANSNDPAVFKDAMHDIWNAPGQTVSDLTLAVTLAKAGTDIDWSGPSGNFDWDENGEPVGGIYAVWSVGEDGQLTIVERGIEA